MNWEQCQRYGSLAFLTIQNSALILTMSRSRQLPGPRYQASTAVFLSELIKLVIGLAAFVSFLWPIEVTASVKAESEKEHLLGFDPNSSDTRRKQICELCNLRRFGPLVLPSLLYTIQNNLQFIAISNLDAATFQVAYQGKILTTAMFSVVLLNKKLSITQAFSIVLLSLGIACASLASTPTTSKSFSHKERNHALGFGAVSISCLLSGLAGVYTEAVLKKTQYANNKNPGQIFWLRNVQLSMCSVIFSGTGIFVFQREALSKHGFLSGYNATVWMAVFLQAIGGRAVAFVVTATDNILKGFATSISVIISTIMSALLWDFHLTPTFFGGLVAVLTSTYLYTTKPKVTEEWTAHGKPELLTDDMQRVTTQWHNKKAFVVKTKHISAYTDV